MNAKKMVAGGIVVFAIVLAVAHVRTTYVPPPPPPPAQQVAAQPPTRVITVVEKVWKIETFDIQPEGLRVYLYQGWKDFPLGGNIVIVTPSGERLHDGPGVITHFGFQTDGTYTIYPDPSGSTRSVQLYNKW